MRRNEKSNSGIYVLIAIIAIIGFISFKVFTGSDNNNVNNIDKEIISGSTMISPIGVDSEVIIHFNNGSKSKAIKLSEELKPIDNLASVSNGEMKLESQDGTIIYLNGNSSTGKIKYNGNISGVETFTLISSDAWIEAGSNIKLILDNFKVDLSKNTVINASQTQVGSAISVFKGSVNIDINGKSVNIVEGNNFLLLKKDVKSDIKVDKFITDISEEYLKSDWFIKHDSGLLFNNINNKDSKSNNLKNSKNTDTKNSTKVASKYLIFTSPNDESVTQKSEVIFEGKVLSPLVKKITINNNNVDITNGKFKLEGIKLTRSEQNFIYRVFDDSGFKLDKGVITIYSSSDSLKNTDSNNAGDNLNNKDSSIKEAKITKPVTINYKANPIDYTITNPSPNPLTTTLKEITIRGKVPPEIAYITVNGFRLNKYTQGNKSFRYHAFTRFKTLKEGKNNYTIKYYSKDGQILNTKFVVIYKTGGTYSNEASL